jgi:hypothetical protein
MIIKKAYQRIFYLTLTALLLAGCGEAKPNSLAAKATPSDAKPSSSYEWVAVTDFGKFAFDVNSAGNGIILIRYEYSKTCDSNTNGGRVVWPKSWPITDGKFSIDFVLDWSGQQAMNFSGTYSATDQKFVGTWTGNSNGSICSGAWEAAATK